MRYTILTLLGLASFTNAWLPTDKGLFGSESTNASTVTVPIGNGRSMKRWLPASGKIRGVNLGSLFIMEPWMAGTEWSNMGCGNAVSEFDCVLQIGQSAANTAFQNHWNSWITESDLNTMQSYGINTIRIPVGYWIDESTVYQDSEHFPQGALPYLTRLCGWASDRGFYIIIDLHGAPGAQVAQQPFTGQYAPTAGFYQGYQYSRAYSFLSWMTNIIHTTNEYRNVGMIEVLNEPIGGQSSLISEYYPNAYNAVRNAESALGITANNYLHIQFMDASWGAGNPKASLSNQYFAAYDNHRYLKWDSSVTLTHAGYISKSCSDSVASDGDTPLIVGEWSLSVNDDVQSNSDFEVNDSNNLAFYKQWWAAQIIAYEKQEGWIFWSWKAQLGDYRWSYKDAVAAGAISTNPSDAYNYGAC